jgi:hypothetical protein
MGLIKFVDIDEETYFANVEGQDDPDTIYFIGDNIYQIRLQGDVYKGGIPEPADTSSATLELVYSNGELKMQGAFKLSSEEGNSLEARKGGYWAPPAGIPLIENPVEDNFAAVDATGILKDSGYSLATAVTQTSGDYLPSAAAVYETLNTLPLYWDDAREDLEGTPEDPTWKSYLSSIQISGLDRRASYFHSNGKWAKFHFEIEVLEYSPETSKAFLPWPSIVFPVFYVTINETYNDGPISPSALVPEFTAGEDYALLRLATDFSSLIDGHQNIRAIVTGAFPIDPLPAE